MKTKKKQQTVTGTIKSIKYRNGDNWSIFKLDTGEKCTGILPEICDTGTEVECTGEFVQGSYGPQLKCSQVVPTPPDTNSAAGVIKLLQRLPGIGPKKAEKVVAERGHEKAWSLALNSPADIGVLKKNCEAAQEIARSLVGSFEIFTYLLGIGLTDYQANKIIARYGESTTKTVSENPYCLIDDIEGFGFLTVDKIALKAGIKIGSQSRLNAAVIFCLNDSEMNNGHIYQWGKDLIGIVLDNLTESAKKSEMSLMGMPVYEDVKKTIYFLREEGRLVIDKGKVFSAELLEAEKVILEVVK